MATPIVAATADVQHSAWIQIDSAEGTLNNAAIAIEMAMEEAAFRYDDAEAAGRAQERLVVLLQSIRSYVGAARDVLQQEVALLMNQGAQRG